MLPLILLSLVLIIEVDWLFLLLILGLIHLNVLGMDLLLVVKSIALKWLAMLILLILSILHILNNLGRDKILLSSGLHKVLLGKFLLRSTPSILAYKRCVSSVWLLLELVSGQVKGRLGLHLLTEELILLRHLRSRHKSWVISSRPKVLSSRSIWVDVGLDSRRLLERNLVSLNVEGVQRWHWC